MGPRVPNTNQQTMLPGRWTLSLSGRPASKRPPNRHLRECCERPRGQRAAQ